MPELHKLTPALGVLQDRGQRVAIVTDGRMSGASGKVPAAIHVTPEAASVARWRGSRTATWSPSTPPRACSTCTSTGRARRPAGDRWGAAGRGLERHGSRACSRPSGRRSARPTPAPASSPVSSLPSRRCPLRTPSESSLLSRVPVVPVVVVDDPAHAVPVARALVAGGLPVIEPDPAHPGRARRDPGDRLRGRRSWSARARS